MVATPAQSGSLGEPQLEKKPIKFSNLLLGAGLNMFEVTTLGQPLEVVKTTMAAHRGDGFTTALGRIWARGGPLGCEYCLFSIPHYGQFRDLAHFSIAPLFFLVPESPISRQSHANWRAFLKLQSTKA